MSKFKFHKNSTYKSRIKKWVIENSFRLYEWKESGENIIDLRDIIDEFHDEVLESFIDYWDYSNSFKIRTSLGNIIIININRNGTLLNVLSKSDFE